MIVLPHRAPRRPGVSLALRLTLLLLGLGAATLVARVVLTPARPVEVLLPAPPDPTGTIRTVYLRSVGLDQTRYGAGFFLVRGPGGWDAFGTAAPGVPPGACPAELRGGAYPFAEACDPRVRFDWFGRPAVRAPGGSASAAAGGPARPLVRLRLRQQNGRIAVWPGVAARRPIAGTPVPCGSASRWVAVAHVWSCRLGGAAAAPGRSAAGG